MGVITAIPEALLAKTGMKPSTAKLVVYGAITVVAVIGVVIIVRQVKKFLGLGNAPVDKHLVVGHATLTKDDAQSIADRIWNNLDGNMFPTWGGLLTDIPNAETLTSADKTMIYNAFGIHTNGFPFYTKGDLFFWLDRRLVLVGVSDSKTFWGY